MKIVCNKCNEDFESVNIELIEHEIMNLIEVYYLCPHCKAKHHVCWHNEEAKGLQEAIRMAQDDNRTELVENYRAKIQECHG